MTNEAFSRIKTDAQLRDQGCDIHITNALRFEVMLPDGTKGDRAAAKAKQAIVAPSPGLRHGRCDPDRQRKMTTDLGKTPRVRRPSQEGQPC